VRIAVDSAIERSVIYAVLLASISGRR